MHAHTCLTCGAEIERGNFDCEIDQDHDFRDCDECAKEETTMTGGYHWHLCGPSPAGHIIRVVRHADCPDRRNEDHEVFAPAIEPCPVCDEHLSVLEVLGHAAHACTAASIIPETRFSRRGTTVRCRRGWYGARTGLRSRTPTPCAQATRARTCVSCGNHDGEETTMTTKMLPTIDDAIRADDPSMVVQHDGLHDHQTCSSCHRSWGAGQDDYWDCRSADYDAPGVGNGIICPDTECGGQMGVRASAHVGWREG